MRRQQFGHENGQTGQSYGQQLAEIHANALPGVTRSEEGQILLNGHSEHLENGNFGSHHQQESKASDALRRNYVQMERSRERDRYEDYLDEQDSEKLPSAFDLGWRRNMQHLFGTKWVLWLLPICNTSGDGWHWEASPKWLEARDEVRREREAQGREDAAFRRWDEGEGVNRGRWPDQAVLNPQKGAYFSPDGSPGSRMSMQTLRRRGSFDDFGSDDWGDSSNDSDHGFRSGQSRSPDRDTTMRKQD